MHSSTLQHGLFAVLLGFFLTSTASGQLESRLYLDKHEYQVGEPVYLGFDLTNNGTEPMQVITGNSYSFCGGYQIEISSDPSADLSSCSTLGFGWSCASGAWAIAPGETRHDKVLLNFEHDLSKAGIYSVRASRTLNYGSAAADLADLSSGVQLKTESLFHRPYVADLHSKDEESQHEAARVIGTLAPPFLEDTILSMLDSAVTHLFALTGLRHLNTSRAREALARIVQGTSGYSYAKEQAIKYLSEMEDKKYFPLLLDEAKKQEANQARDYVLAAAQLGGEDAMPYVATLVSSSDAFSRANGVMALPLTGSRRAVPVLIDLLLSPDVDLARLASIGLIRLSHRSPFETGQWFSNSPSNEYANWIGWWRLRVDDAPIYGPNQCGKIEPLR